MHPFSPNFKGIKQRLQPNGLEQLYDVARKKWVAATPEEWVRQGVLQWLIVSVGISLSLVAVERLVTVSGRKRRFDLVVYNKDGLPWMLVECKAPSVPLTANVLQQILSYQRVIQSTYFLVTNGNDHYTGKVVGREVVQVDGVEYP